MPALLTRISTEPKAAHGLLDQFLGVLALLETSVLTARARTPVFSISRGGFAGFFAHDVGNDDVHPFLGQALGDGLADAARRAGDDGVQGRRQTYFNSFMVSCILPISWEIFSRTFSEMNL